MYIATVPNRKSPPAILLREGYREGGKVKTRTLANITQWPIERIEALRRCLKGEFDGLSGKEVSDRIFGVLFVLKEMAGRLGITRVLGRGLMAKLALFLILARVAHQGSRLSAVRWSEDHAVAETLGLPHFNENDLYAALDWLTERQERIEEKLYRAYVKRVGSPPVLVLYDVTSSYLEGEKNELAEFGYDRDGKRGKRQILIGLLTADDGEPLAGKVFKGNTSDSMTVADQIDTLKKRFGVEEVVFVGDRGMVKAKGKKALNDEGLRYITALSNPQVRKLLKEKVIQLDLFDETVREVEHGAERLVLRRNNAVARRESARRQDKIEKLIKQVEQRNAFVRGAKRADPESGLRRLTRWAARHKLSSFIMLHIEERELQIQIDEEGIAEAGLLDGCYVIVTDVPKEKMDASTVDARYRDLQKVERDFRTIKTGFLEVRPVFVRKEVRTRAHVFVAMLALKIVRELDGRLKDAFGTTSQGAPAITVENALGALSRLCFRRHEIKDKHFLTLPMPDDKQEAIFKALSVPPPKYTNRRIAKM